MRYVYALFALTFLGLGLYGWHTEEGITLSLACWALAFCNALACKVIELEAKLK